jgi:hypothetical protein
MPATSKLDREFKLEVPLEGCGPVLGRRYRFERSGAQLIVDPRDRLPLAAVPHLRQVSNI